MDEAVEEEEAVFEELMPVQQHVEEEQNDGMEADLADSEQMEAVEEVGEHAEDGPLSSGSSDGFMEVSRLSPPRDNQDDELACANCNNFRDNSLKAFEAAGDMAKLQAEHNDILIKYDALAKNNAKASMEVEECFKEKRGVEVRLEAVQVDLKMAVDEVQRLRELNKQYLETARLADKHRRAADDWRDKYVQSQALLIDKVEKCEGLEEKYRNATILAKDAVDRTKEMYKKLAECKEKLAGAVKENKMLKKQCTNATKIIENIRESHLHLLPADVRDAINALTTDDLVELANTNIDPNAIDDDDADDVLRLMNAGNAAAPVVVSPPKTRGAARGRGNRGGRRGRGGSVVSGGHGGGERVVPDESMHENLLARKLHRNDDEETPAQPANSAAKSVMGKKTETVREQQERQKAGMKDRIAELKKDYNVKQSQTKKAAEAAADPAAEDAPPAPRAPAVEEDMFKGMFMSDDDGGSDNESDHGLDPNDREGRVLTGNEEELRQLELEAQALGVEAAGASSSFDFDLDMDTFDFGDVAAAGGSGADSTPQFVDGHAPHVAPIPMEHAFPFEATPLPPRPLILPKKIDEAASLAAPSKPAVPVEPVGPSVPVPVEPVGPSEPASSSAVAAEAEEKTPSLAVKEQLQVEVSMEQEEHAVADAADAADAAFATSSAAKTAAIIEDAPTSSTLASPPSKAPSPSKMILPPRVAELSQERADSDVSRAVGAPKKKQSAKEAVTAAGLDMSDSENEDEDEDEEKKQKKKEDDDEAERKRRQKEEMERAKEASLALMRTPPKLSAKSPQKSPLAIERPKPPVASTPVRLPPTQPITTPLAASAAAAAGPSTSRAAPPLASPPVQQQQPPSSFFFDDILAGAHQTAGSEQKQRIPKRLSRPRSRASSPPAASTSSSSTLTLLMPLQKQPPKTPQKKGTGARGEEAGLDVQEETQRSAMARRNSASTRKKVVEEDAGSEKAERAEDSPVFKRTRSRSMARSEVDPVELETKTPRKAAPKTPAKPTPKTPAKAPPKTPAKAPPKAPPKTPAKAPPKTPAKAPPKTPAKAAPKTPAKPTPKTPAKRAPRTPSKKSVELPKSGLSDASSDDEKEEEDYTPTVARGRTARSPAARAAPAAVATAVASSSRHARATAANTTANAAISCLPSTSTKVEAVPRMERQGAYQAGAAKEAAARMRDESLAAVAAPAATASDPPVTLKRGRGRPKKNAAETTPAAAAAAQDDVTPFARNSRRTAVAAPRRSTTAAPAASADAQQPQPQLEIGDAAAAVEQPAAAAAAVAPAASAAASDDLLVDLEPDFEAEELPLSPPKKRIARMGSNGEEPVAVPVVPAATVAATSSAAAADPVVPAAAADNELLLEQPSIVMADNDDADNGGMLIDEGVEEEMAAPSETPAPAAPVAAALETEAAQMPQEEEAEVVPDSCIVEDVEGGEEEEKGEEQEEPDEGAPEASASKPAMQSSDNEEELGDLLIDSGPNSPAPSPTPRSVSPTVPLDTVPIVDTVPPASSGAAKELQWPVNPPEASAPRVPAQPPKLTPASVAARSPSPAAVEAAAAIEEVAQPAAAAAAPVRGGAASRGRGRGGLVPPTRGHVPVVGGPLRGSAIYYVRRRALQGRASASTSDSESQDGSASSISEEAAAEAEPAAAVATAATTTPAAAAPVARPVAIGPPTRRTAAAPGAAANAEIACPAATVSLEEKRRAISAAISRGGMAGGSRGARGGGRGGGVAAGGGGASAAPRVAPSAGGSRMSGMAAQVAIMKKNLSSGKPAMTGTARQQHQPTVRGAKTAAAAPVGSSSSSREVTPPSQHPAAAVAVALKLALAKEKKNSDPLPKKRKASAMSAPRAEAVAIHAPEKAARGPSTSAAVPAHSADSRLIATVASVCRGEETVDKAMQQLEIATMPLATIVKCVCKALTELPQSNTWHVVWSSMRMKAVEVDGNRVVPKAEKELFALMQRMQASDQRLDGLFDCFYGEYCRAVLGTMNTSYTTADVARNVRCLFFALVETNKAEDEKVEDAQKFFQQMLQNKSSQAVLQSLVFLLCQTNTAALASEILRTELDDDEHRGRLISMHMNNTKDAEVLQWAVNRFAFDSCKTLATAAYKTTATLAMVQGWWASDMEYVERAREHPGAVSFNARGNIQFDKFNKELIVRTPLLISPKFRIEGLDRVGMLAQLDTPAFEAMDRVFATGDDHAVSVFADTSASGSRKRLDRGEAFVLVIKLHIAIAALTSFYADRMYGADQREALRLHLAMLIEKAHAILESPEVNDLVVNSDDDDSSGAEEEIGLSLLIAAIRKWLAVVQRLTKKDLMETPAASSAESSPVKKKRARSEEYGSNEPSTSQPAPPPFAR